MAAGPSLLPASFLSCQQFQSLVLRSVDVLREGVMGILCTSVGDTGGDRRKHVWPCMEDNEQKTRGVEAKRSEGTVANSELIRPAVEQLCFAILTAQTFPGSPDGRVRLRLPACLPACSLFISDYSTVVASLPAVSLLAL